MAQKKSKALLITNGTVVTLGDNNRIISDGAVLVVDGVIQAVGKAAAVKKQARGAKVLDAGGKVIMPGFINAHMHLYSTFCRGLSPKQPPATNFVEVLERLWWPLDNALNGKDVLYSSLIPLIDCIKNGTTTIIDHHESQSFQTGSLSVIEKACRKAGVRSALTLGISDRYKKGEEGIEENVRFLKKIQAKRKKGDDLVSAMMGLHAKLFTVNDKSLKKSCDLAREFDCGMHVHIAEDKADQAANKKQYGKSVIERLHAAGGLGPKTLAIHCVHVGDREIGLMAKTGTCAVHNPESNMNNAVGVAPVMKMMEKGALVGLGTDAMTTDMKAEVRVANVFHKHAREEFAGVLCRGLQPADEEQRADRQPLLQPPGGRTEEGQLRRRGGDGLPAADPDERQHVPGPLPVRHLRGAGGLHHRERQGADAGWPIEGPRRKEDLRRVPQAGG